MATLRQGSTGQSVRDLQRKLNTVLDANLVVDGQFGPATTRAVRMYQTSIDELVVDGVVGPQTMASINRVYAKKADRYQGLGKGQFVIFGDAGHGGLDHRGVYVTPGKRARHDGKDYYEGVENRLAAEAFIQAATKAGYHCIRTYHPYKDTPLYIRANTVKEWLDQDCSGYLHSFHSNAISSDNTPEVLEATRGYMVFTGLGNNLSDQIAKQHLEHIKEETAGEWVYRDNRGACGPDHDKNFQILRQTDLSQYPFFGAILSEYGFHTSKSDVDFITSKEGRWARTQASLRTAKWVHEEWKKQSQAT